MLLISEISIFDAIVRWVLAHWWPPRSSSGPRLFSDLVLTYLNKSWHVMGTYKVLVQKPPRSRKSSSQIFEICYYSAFCCYICRSGNFEKKLFSRNRSIGVYHGTLGHWSLHGDPLGSSRKIFAKIRGKSFFSYFTSTYWRFYLFTVNLIYWGWNAFSIIKMRYLWQMPCGPCWCFVLCSS